MSYILITPVKNEVENLPIIAECIVRQTVLPKLWVIVDGNSEDGTLNMVKNLSNKFDWIYYIKQNNYVKQGHLSFAWAVKEGYEYANELCLKNNIKYNYFGKVDADVILSPNYFEELIKKFESNPRLGIASGLGYTLKLDNKESLYENIDKKETKRNFHITNELPDKRLYRKKCLNDVKGFPISNAPDTVILVKARLKGWETKLFEDINFYDIREGSSAQRGLWKGAKMEGYVKYYLNYHPLLVIISILHKLSKKPYYPAAGIFYGYISSVLKRMKKIDDTEIKEYFRKKKIKELLNL